MQEKFHCKSRIHRIHKIHRSGNKRLQLKLQENSRACWKQWKSLRAVTSNCSSLKNGTRLQSLYYVGLRLSHFLLLQRLLTTNLSNSAVTIVALSPVMSLPYFAGSGTVNDHDYTALWEVQYQKFCLHFTFEQSC